MQASLPIWVGATGTSESFARAGALGLPLALGVIGGEYRRLRPLVDLYRAAGARAGYPADKLRVAVHAVGYVAEEAEQAPDEFFPAYDTVFGSIARKIGRSSLSRARLAAVTGPDAALVVGSPDEVAANLAHIDEVLGGVSRVCLKVTVGTVERSRRLRAIELLGDDARTRLRSRETA